MTDAASIQALQQQEDVLIFPGFDEATAHDVGTALRATASANKSPVVIEIRTASRRLFFTALPGSSPDNEDWARRKGNVSLRCHASSMRVGLMLQSKGRSPWPDAALDTKDYAVHGGAVPVRVEGTGVVAVIAVSGLPSREDHDLIVRVMADYLGVQVITPTP